MSLAYTPYFTSSTLSGSLAKNADMNFLGALNSCKWPADLQLKDFHRLHPGTDHLISVIVRNDSTCWDVGRQSCQYRLGNTYRVPNRSKTTPFQTCICRMTERDRNLNKQKMTLGALLDRLIIAARSTKYGGRHQKSWTAVVMP